MYDDLQIGPTIVKIGKGHRRVKNNSQSMNRNSHLSKIAFPFKRFTWPQLPEKHQNMAKKFEKN